MAKEKRLVITGEQQSSIDAAAVARVIIRLARHWWQDRQAAPPSPAAPEARRGKAAS
jgi:hypothetical protein